MNGNSSLWCINGLSSQKAFEIKDDENGVRKFIEMSLDFIAGCLGGVAGLVVGHPLDTIKVHLQTQDGLKPKYRGTWHCFTTLLREEKVRGLYRGMASPMAGVSLINAVVFGIYGNVQRNMSDPNSLTSHFYAGCAAGLIQSFICSPIELAKTRLQLQTSDSVGVKHSGSLQCLRYIWRTEGSRGFFRGLTITAIRDLPGFSAYFVAYEYLMRLPSSPNSLHAFFAGGFAGIASWFACYPMDVIKTSLQAESANANPKYTGIMDCIRKGYAEGGLRFFFRGFTPTLIRGFPANGACFTVVYLFMRLTSSKPIDMLVQTNETLIINNLSSAPVYHMHQQGNRDDIFHQHWLHSVTRSMKASNGFNEAVCHREVEELANDLYARSEKQHSNHKYYILEDHRILSSQYENSTIE